MQMDRNYGQPNMDKTARRTKMIAALAIMTAVSTVFLVIGTLISVNTVFFTAAASFLVGIAVVKYGFGAGLMLFMGSAVLDLILNPDKFHVILYLAMGGFILVAEGSYKLLEKHIMNLMTRNLVHLVIRIAVFFLGYMPIVLFFPRLFLTAETWTYLAKFAWLRFALPGVGVIAFVIFDLAYLFVKKAYLHIFRI